jgi:hypothetical protein
MGIRQNMQILKHIILYVKLAFVNFCDIIFADLTGHQRCRACRFHKCIKMGMDRSGMLILIASYSIQCQIVA